MKLLLDTSYFLPLVKVQVNELPANMLQDLLSNPSIELHYCDVTLFEMAAKAMKLIAAGESIDVQDVRIGVDALEHDERLQRDSWSDHPFGLELASTLRKIHSDFIDCLILATAACHAETFATMDDELYNKIAGEPAVIQQILEFNAHFQFWFGDLSKPPVRLEFP
jgi:predicted nucleic acid-binding protein